MAAVRGILVKQFGGPEVLEYVTSIVQSSKPTGRQVHAFAFLLFNVSMTGRCS